MRFNGIIRETTDNKGEICNAILRSLPRWFGIEKAIIDYVYAVEHLPTLIAQINNETIGFISIEFHNP